MKKVISSFILASFFASVAGQQPELLKNINYGSESSYIIYMTELRGKVIFKATNSGNTNNELWITDGTVNGTYLLKEINPSTKTGSDIGPITVFNEEAYFSANDGTHGDELWKTDGTTEGTVMVKDISPGILGSKPGDLVVWNNLLYFSAYHPDYGKELWRTDGTAESTHLVADLIPGTASSHPAYLFTTSCGIYFSGLNNLFLYFSDGTPTGSFLLSDNISVGQLDNAFFTEFNDTVYFRAIHKTSGAGSQLWKTSGNTVLMATSIVSSTTEFDPRYLTVAGGKMFMMGEMKPFGSELWVLDESGVHMVKDINPNGHANLSGAFFTEFKGKLVFTANIPEYGQEVWVSDGTEEGTKIIKDINPGTSGSMAISPVIIGDTLYFSADDGTGGELWRLASPDLQPEKFTNIPNGGAWGPELRRIGNTFVFSAGDAVNGTELWKMTTGIPPDIDNDGILNEEEYGPAGQDNTYDGNNDGLPDALQSNVASFHIFDHSAYVTLVSPVSTQLKEVSAEDNPSPVDQPEDINFPLGFLKFTVTGLDPGGTAAINLYFSSELTPVTYYKYAKTTGNPEPHWYEFLHDGQTGAVIEPGKISLHFIDGARGDEDLAQNGVIVDIGGPGGKNPTTGVAEFNHNPSQNRTIIAYPNPVSSFVNIGFTLYKPSDVRIEIYSSVGQKVYTFFSEGMVAGSHQIKFNSGSIPDGIYLLSFEAGDLRDSGKFIVSR